MVGIVVAVGVGFVTGASGFFSSQAGTGPLVLAGGVGGVGVPLPPGVLGLSQSGVGLEADAGFGCVTGFGGTDACTGTLACGLLSVV